MRDTLKWLDMPPNWLLFFLALVWAQSHFLPFGGFGRVGVPAGWALVVLGLALAAAASFEFLRHRTTIVPHRMPTSFIVRGIYRITRNPIYLGDAFVLAGAILILGALPSLILIPVFVRIITVRFILGEEARLRARFGAAFEKFEGETRRWL